jgi:hypothetical protein
MSSDFDPWRLRKPDGRDSSERFIHSLGFTPWGENRKTDRAYPVFLRPAAMPLMLSSSAR